ncbi:TetR/AcrR family transcriptional regulator [Candidatus Thiodiazotropha endoloripes]|uniref:TetR family transcriptional regulator n=1 Tax=Candidatus Thiodiazotropha endoloripes TaxID=1818881 RepID=A0A1E2UH38_9GAMM|nr:TetR/AcrR family transcriptional regulator [Candidatus Thiodiazotropha endoloripes]ODB91944.1 TetR family transcriptional regulator [Candidatus Thiodiazotropha endoloripes]
MSSAIPLKRRRGRPPKDQAGFSQTKAELIRSGMEVLTEKGYSATGIDEILRRVGVPKGSFYHYFKNKDAFGSELISNYAKFFEHKLDKSLGNQSLPPLQRLIAFMQDATDGMARHRFKRGCLVGNLGQEMGALPESFRTQLIEVFEAWQQRLEACLEEAKATGDISANKDCKESAYLFWTGWEGAVLRAKLERSPRALQSYADFFINSLK